MRKSSSKQRRGLKIKEETKPFPLKEMFNENNVLKEFSVIENISKKN